MVDVKTMVFNALQEAFPDIEISDEFPDDFSGITQIQYTEEENKAKDISATGVINSYVRYRIDIWSQRNTSTYAVEADAALFTNVGLIRSGCSDANEPQRKHKIMRYEGIIDERTKRVYAPS